jgi:hypothetical protein
MTFPYTYATAVGLVVLLIFTRLFSASRTKSVSNQDGTKSVPAMPYWLPIVSGTVESARENKTHVEYRNLRQATTTLITYPQDRSCPEPCP